MQVVELLPVGAKMRTGYEIRRDWRERISEGRKSAPLDEVAVWLEQATDFPYSTVLDPEQEEVMKADSFTTKAMPVLRRGPNGRWERCQMLLATYHAGSVVVLVAKRVSPVV